MTTRPRLVFIHGTSGFKDPDKWLEPLNGSLRQMGIAPWDAADVVSPNYAPLLRRRSDEKQGLPSRNRAQAGSAADFDANRRELSEILRRFGTSKKARGQATPERMRGDALVTLRFLSPPFRKTARKYLRRRNLVCNSILTKLDAAGPGTFIIIGYSLGSVIAADLLPRLRAGQHVRLLATVGSPLSAGYWDQTLRGLKHFPYDRLDAWVNIYNRRDWITGRVGLEPRIPQAIDVRIGRFPQPDAMRKPRSAVLAQHKIGGYTRHASLAAAIAWALHGSRDEGALRV